MFWASSANKQNLQLLTWNVAQHELDSVVISGMVVNDELVSSCHKQDPSALDLPELNKWQEEADCHIIPHTEW